MDKNVLHDCLHAALDGKMSFPETVGKMIQTGVERYRADLVLLEKTHYAANGGAHIEKIPLERAPAIASEFSANAVKSAIEDIQQRRIDYAEFLRRVMKAGITDYSVYLTGKKAIYYGRKGDFHVEHFPVQRAE
ncbi:MAG: DUF1398 family protein [Bryobacteraceae bacterium]